MGMATDLLPIPPFPRIIEGYFDEAEWRSAENVEGALPVCNRVGLVSLRGSNVYGTCIRLSERWILTAHHVVTFLDQATRFEASSFGFIAPSLGSPPIPLDPMDKGYWCSEDGLRGRSGIDYELDYALIRLAASASTEVPEPTQPISVARTAPRIGTRPFIPQFVCPETRYREPAQCGTDQCVAACDEASVTPLPCAPLQIQVNSKTENYPDSGEFTLCDDATMPYVFHRAATLPGCSGAPIFNRQWELVGIHTHGPLDKNKEPNKKCLDWRTPTRNCHNWGTRINCIVEDAARQGFDFRQIPCLLPLVPT